MSGYRFLKMTSAYPEFVASFLRERPDHHSWPYDQLYEQLIRTRYGLSDFYARHMERLGNQAWEIFASIEVMQRAWARENGVTPGGRTWLWDVAEAQVQRLQPDVIFLQDLFLFDEAFRKKLRDAAPPHCVLVGWRSSPTPDLRTFRDLDLILSAFPHFVARWRELGLDARLLPLAFEPKVLEEVGDLERDIRFSFVGQIGSSDGPHRYRKQLIETLSRETDLQVHGGVSVPPTTLRQRVRSSIRQRSLGALRGPRESPRVRGGLHPPVFGLEYYRVLGRSMVTLNQHIDASEDHASNLRMYEATGMGACLLTDRKTDLDRYFVEDKEVLSYGDADECVEKVRFLLDHPEETETIALAGQRRTLTEHTYEQRVAVLDGWLAEMLMQGGKRA